MNDSLQKVVSLVNSTVTPADEQAAARESVAVTCIILNQLVRYNQQDKNKIYDTKRMRWHTNTQMERDKGRTLASLQRKPY